MPLLCHFYAHLIGTKTKLRLRMGVGRLIDHNGPQMDEWSNFMGKIVIPRYPPLNIENVHLFNNALLILLLQANYSAYNLVL